jgi:very-short-patch-repair endonuclease
VTRVTGSRTVPSLNAFVNSNEIERCLQLLARRQHGVVALDQLMKGGVTRGVIRGLCNRGRLQPLLPRVFRLDAAPTTKRMRCMATALWAGSGAAISGRTAAELHELLDPAAGPIEVFGPVNRTPRPGIVHRRRPLETFEMCLVDNIPTLSVTRTLLDLCESIDESTCEIALDAALREGLVDFDSLKDLVQMASRRRLGGVRTLRELVEVRGDDEAMSESELESRVFRLLRTTHYPLPQRQYPLDLSPRRGRADFYYPEANLVIEVDGRRWHAGRRPETRDRRRDHSLVLDGNRVLRFTWEDVVHEPEYFLEVVGEALGLLVRT